MSNSDKPIDLDSSVSEQISDMQLLRLRQTSIMRELSYDEIKMLEILTKVKNVETEKRLGTKKDAKQLKTDELKKLASEIPAGQLEVTSESKKTE